VSDNSDTTNTAPYDYATAQAILKQKQALAQALMQTQAPASYSVVPGGPNGFVVPNKWGGLNAALSKAMGAYMMKSSMDDQKNQTAQSNASLLQALSAAQSPVSQVTNTPVTVGGSQGLTSGSSDPSQDNSSGAASDNDSAPTQDSQGNLLPVTSQQDYMTQSERPKTMAENMPNYMQMANSGPVGAQIAGAMMTPVAPVAVAPGSSLVNPRTGQPIYSAPKYSSVAPGAGVFNENTGQVTPSSTGDPSLVSQALDLKTKTDPTNPAAMQALNALEAKAGLPQSSPQAVAGGRSTPLQSAQAGEAGANTAFTQGPKTVSTNAGTNLTNAQTASTQVKTGIDAVDALSGAQSDVAVKQNDLDRTTRAMALASNGVGGSKPAATLGDLQNVVGSNPQFAEYKGLLSVDGLSSIKNAMQSRMGQQEFNKLFPSQVSPSMPTQSVLQLLDLNRKLQLTDLGVARNKVQNLSNIAQPVGVTPGAGTQPSGNGFQIPGQ
jgi:hypothetical protein